MARRGGGTAVAFPPDSSPSVSKLSLSSMVRRLDRYGTRFFVELRSCWLRTRTQSCSLPPSMSHAAHFRKHMHHFTSHITSYILNISS